MLAICTAVQGFPTGILAMSLVAGLGGLVGFIAGALAGSR